jgi:hypothetical protein
MTQESNSNRNISRTMGIAMWIIGSVVLVTYSLALAGQFQVALNSGAVDSFGLFGNLALTSLRVVRAVAFDHAVALSVVRDILILFSAFIVILIGVVFVARQAKGVTPYKQGFSARPTGDR